jgi:hypothetical protein
MSVNKLPERVTDRDKAKFGDRFFEDVLEWVRDHQAITEVFSEEEIMGWVEDRLKLVRETHDPEDIFTDADLAAWAESNGYVREK